MRRVRWTSFRQRVLWRHWTRRLRTANLLWGLALESGGFHGPFRMRASQQVALFNTHRPTRYRFYLDARTVGLIMMSCVAVICIATYPLTQTTSHSIYQWLFRSSAMRFVWLSSRVRCLKKKMRTGRMNLLRPRTWNISTSTWRKPWSIWNFSTPQRHGS